jgi:hypothetical protein
MLTENICSLDFRCIVAQCLMINESKYSPLNISVILVVNLYIQSAKSIELAIHLYQWSSTWGTGKHLNVICNN